MFCPPKKKSFIFLKKNPKHFFFLPLGIKTGGKPKAPPCGFKTKTKGGAGGMSTQTFIFFLQSPQTNPPNNFLFPALMTAFLGGGFPVLGWGDRRRSSGKFFIFIILRFLIFFPLTGAPQKTLFVSHFKNKYLFFSFFWNFFGGQEVFGGEMRGFFLGKKGMFFKRFLKNSFFFCKMIFPPLHFFSPLYFDKVFWRSDPPQFFIGDWGGGGEGQGGGKNLNWPG